MLAIVSTGVLIARLYYQGQNRALDPRIVPARELYSKYDRLAAAGDYYGVFSLLDSVERIYRAYPHYTNSYELGVLNNNRGAALLTLALYRDSIPPSSDPFYSLDQDSLVQLAEVHIRSSIETYLSWQNTYEGLNEAELEQKVGEKFWKEWSDGVEKQPRMLSHRIDEIETALMECPRRLSVCYSNLGLTSRINGAYEEAVSHYLRALELWDRNLEAENNLNRLLNKPLKKRNFIQKLFPPSRNGGSS